MGTTHRPGHRADGRGHVEPHSAADLAISIPTPAFTAAATRPSKQATTETSRACKEVAHQLARQQ
eukprot:3628128-Pyramimonas_sp.AAC.1